MPEPEDRARAAADLVAWYEAMGVDVALDDAAADRTAPVQERALTVQRLASRAPAAEPALSHAPPESTPFMDQGDPYERAPPRAATAATVPPDVATIAAREAARSATTLAELREAMLRFDGCALRKTATQLVFADGNPEGRVMLVGEAPGRDEDIQGLPFVGRSGQLLDRMLGAIGLDRTAVYIANVIPWRPPGNRDPAPHETAMCLPFIRRQIELADPDFLLLLGKSSAHTLFETSEAISRMRGRWRDFDTGKRTIRAMATFHPAYLLRNPLEKRKSWRDFLALKAALESRHPNTPT